jgi:hypothetical protein
MLKDIDWKELTIDDLGGSGNIAHLKIIFPDHIDKNVSNGIIVDIQITTNKLFQIHINIAKDLQRLGLSEKIYKAVIHDLGHLYSGVGRRQNDLVNKIWSKLNLDNDLECLSDKSGNQICISKNNEEEDILKLKNIFSNIGQF